MTSRSIAGDLFIVNSSGSINVVPAAATSSIFASRHRGHPGDARPVRLYRPTALDSPDFIAFDSSGNLYISNYYGGNVLVDRWQRVRSSANCERRYSAVLTPRVARYEQPEWRRRIALTGGQPLRSRLRCRLNCVVP